MPSPLLRSAATLRTVRCTALALPLLAGFAPAQQVDADPRELVVPIHTAAGDSGYGYGVWAAATRFKISFHDGASFVPMLGERYPHNLPWSWRTESVRIGDQELVTQEPRLSYGHTRAEYRLGGVVEAYDVRAEGVEQTLTIARRPASSGDLVVRGAVATELRSPDRAALHGELRFTDERGNWLFTYGAATAVDAIGRRQPMTTAFLAGHVTLRLDGAWLAAATFPVVVDPMLGPGVNQVGNPFQHVDVVRDPLNLNDAVWVAYAAFASAADVDVVLARRDDSGSLGPLAYYDVSSSWSSQGASVAFVPHANRCILVFDRLFSSGSRQLRYHVHMASNTSPSTLAWTLATSDNAWRADVGGTWQWQNGDQALVVWQQEPNGGGVFQNVAGSDVHGAIIDVSVPSSGAPFVVADSVLVDHERPSVNQFSAGGANNYWLVAYQAYTNPILGGSDDWDVAVHKVMQSGAVSAATYLDDGSNDHKLAPIVEGSQSRYLVAFTSSTQAQQPGKPTGVAGHQIRAVRLDWGQSDVAGTEPWGTSVLHSDSTPRFELAGLGYDRSSQSHWALMFRNDTYDELAIESLGYRGRHLRLETVYPATANDTTIGGGVSYNWRDESFAVAYGVNSPTFGGYHYTTADTFAFAPVTPSSSQGAGCSPATIQWSGSQQIGTENGEVRVFSAPAGSIHLLMLATAPASAVLFGIPPIQNGCWLLVPNTGVDFLGFFDLRVGADVSWSLPLPEFLPSRTYYMQDFHTLGSLFEFVSTPRLELPTVK